MLINYLSNNTEKSKKNRYQQWLDRLFSQLAFGSEHCSLVSQSATMDKIEVRNLNIHCPSVPQTIM